MKHKPLYRQYAASILMLMWLFGQGSVIAHDLAIDHGLDVACEWQCTSGKNDDVIANASTSAQLTDFTHVCVQSYSPVNLVQAHFSRPYLRGPPN